MDDYMCWKALKDERNVLGMATNVKKSKISENVASFNNHH